MTLIGGFRLAGVPVLIGDFLLSVNGHPVGLTKKAHLISSNFVAAWTGFRITATSIFGDLNREFGGKKVLKADVECFLTGYDAAKSEKLPISIIGWVIDKGSHCFHWNSTKPEWIHFDEDLYFGSGACVIEQIASEGFFKRQDPQGVEAAVDDALRITTRLMSSEFGAVDSELKTYGHAYEVVYWDDDEFKYLNDITYFGFVYGFDSKGKIVDSHALTEAYRYVNLSDMSLVRAFHLASRRSETNIIWPVWQLGDLTEDVSIQAIFSADREMKQKPHRLLAEHNCLFLILNAPDGERFRVQVNVPTTLNNIPNIPIRLEVIDKHEQISIEHWFVERMYQSLTSSRSKNKEGVE